MTHAGTNGAIPKTGRKRPAIEPKGAIGAAAPSQSHYPPVSPRIMDMGYTKPTPRSRPYAMSPADLQALATFSINSIKMDTEPTKTSPPPSSETEAQQPDVPAPTRAAPKTPDEDNLGVRYPQSEALPVPHTEPESRECTICFEGLPIPSFPLAALTQTCRHVPTACLPCIAQAIKTDISSKRWDQVGCPECPSLLTHTEVKQYAEPADFERYEKFTLNALLSEDPNFRWCPGPGCSSGQVHEGGAGQPIVVCLQCNFRSCFTHGMEWHEGMTCAALDEEVENRRIEAEAEAKRIVEIKVEEKLRTEAETEIKESWWRRWRRSRKEMKENEKRRKQQEFLAKEEARKEMARTREEEEEERLIQLAAKRQKQEEKSRKWVVKETKNCPKCTAPIQKTGGCSHMTCGKCGFEFCWDCFVSHELVIRGDNSLHAEFCRFHPSNMNPGDEIPAYYDDDDDEEWEDR